MGIDVQNEPVAPPFPECEALPGDGEVHVWRASLPAAGTSFSPFESELSDEERERERRFRFRSDAEKFRAAHVALRLILGAYTGIRPRELMFSRSAWGKPTLINAGESGSRLMFNMTDSGDVALVAVSCGRAVGVDIERMKGGDDLSGTALRCFCDAEMDLFRAAPGERREEAFFTFWSRKEAYIKARGEGMSLALRDIDVSIAPALLDHRWSLEDLAVDPGYRGAVVLDGSISRIRYRTIPPHGACAPV